tara:strand:+ start:3302 stop:3676 length:375 start_codon:yes stop_codon:yes gene_type:complete
MVIYFKIKKNMKLKFKIITILSVFLLVGCFTTQSTSKQAKEQEFKEMMDSWLGSSKKELLMSWGSAESVTSDGDNGEIITFNELKRAYLGELGYVTVNHKYMFYINPQKKIYHWNYSRNGRQGY